MLKLYKKQTNKIQYVKMSKAFRKIYLHHQTLYKINNVTEFTNAEYISFSTITSDKNNYINRT